MEEKGLNSEFDPKRIAINPFKLERYFAEYEFKSRYLLSASDCEALAMSDLLQWADAECKNLWNNLHLGYTESAGNPLLRQEIATLYPGISSNQVMVAVPEEAIFIAMQTLLQPGDHAVVISPAYQSLYELAKSAGCQVTLWKIQPKGQGWGIDLDFLEASITPQTKMLVINFPHNPTGYLPVVGRTQ